MKTKLVVTCSCGRKWEYEESLEKANALWQILEIVDPRITTYTENSGDQKTMELALRIMWSRHSLYRNEKGDKNSHDAHIEEIITIDKLEELREGLTPPGDYSEETGKTVKQVEEEAIKQAIKLYEARLPP